MSPCRQELNSQGPRVIEMTQKSLTNRSRLWNVMGSHCLKKMNRVGWKRYAKRNLNLEPKLVLGGGGFHYFHPWAAKVAQETPEGVHVGPKGAQSSPKDTKRTRNLSLNGVPSA